MNMDTLLNEVGFGNVGNIFGDMSIAEDEIEQAQARHPEQADDVWGAFRSLQRPVALRDKAEALYRAHCAELLDRVASGGDVDFATRVEVMVVLSEATLETRLRPNAEHLYLRLFLEAGFPLKGQSFDGLKRDWAWDVDGQNEVFSQIARRLDTKR